MYISQPKGFVNDKRINFLCKLNKGLYGFKQAPRAWFQRVKKPLIDKGFPKFVFDFRHFVLKNKKVLSYILINVDNILLTCQNYKFKFRIFM